MITILRRFARTVLFGSSRADEREAKRRTTAALKRIVIAQSTHEALVRAELALERERE